MAPPTSVIRPTCRSTIARTRAASAPSAMRTPISRVRCATVYASTPYRPTAASSVASDGERRRQRADHPIEEDVLPHLLRHRLQVLDRQVRIELRDHRRDRAAAALGIERRAHVEVASCRASCSGGTARRRPAAPRCLHLAVLRVLHEADDLDVERVVPPLDHPLADGVAAEAELLRERLVDDRDLRRAGASARVNSRPRAAECRACGSSPGRPR